LTSTSPSGEQGEPIRVLTGNVLGIRMQLLRRLLEQQSDMVLVGETRDRVELLVAAAAGVDIVILGSPQVRPPPGICTHLLSEYPDLRIVVLSESSDAAVVYWLGLRRHRLRAVSATTLTGAIRRAYALNPTL
jgi:DNA-binding NarL/FixJ family response regulator